MKILALYIPPMGLEKYNFLIIDNDPDDHDFISMAIKNVFPSAGITHMFDGVELMRAKFPENEKPNVILLDLNMGLVGGKASLQYLQKNKELKDIPVVIMTTAGEFEAKEKYLELGASNLFRKPYSQKEMSQIIREIAGL